MIGGRAAGQGQAPSSQALELDPDWNDDFSVYSYSKIGSNLRGESAILWVASGPPAKLVARTWTDGALSPSTDERPVVLFSEDPLDGGIVDSDAFPSRYANMDVRSRGDELYVAFRFGGAYDGRLGFTHANLSSIAALGDYRSWRSASGNAPPAPGEGSDGYGYDMLPESTFAPSVIASTDGQVVIASESSDLTLDIWRFDGSTWSSGRIYSDASVSEPDLEIDADGNLRVVFHVAALNAVLAASCNLCTSGVDPTVPSNWRKADGTAGFDVVIARDSVPLYSRAYVSVWGQEVRVAALSYDKTTFFFNVLRGGTWVAGTGQTESGWVIPVATSQPRFPYTFYQWSVDAAGDPWLFWERDGSVAAARWNGSEWMGPVVLGSGAFVNVVGQRVGTGTSGLLAFSRDALAGNLVLFRIPPPAPPPDATGPHVVEGSLVVTPSSLTSPGTVVVAASIDDTGTGNSPIAGAELFVDQVSDPGTGSPMQPAPGEAFHARALTNVTWSGVVDLPVGTHTVWVRGLDEAGNWGAFVSAVFEILPPPPPSYPWSTLLESWLGWSVTGDTEVAFHAVDDDGLRSVALWASYSSDNASFGGWASAGDMDVAGTDVVASIPFRASAGPGWYRLTIGATNIHGLSDDPFNKTPSLLGHDPSLPAGLLQTDAYWHLSAVVQITLEAYDDVAVDSVSLLLASSADNVTFGAWEVVSEWAGDARQWSAVWSGTLASGFYRACLEVTDASGQRANAGCAQWLAFAVDTAPPEVRFLDPPPAVSRAQWTATYAAADELQLSRAAVFLASSTDNVSWSPWDEVANGTIAGRTHEDSVQIDPGLSEGWVRVGLVVFDMAGRRSPGTANNIALVRIDAVPPDISILEAVGEAWFSPSAFLHVRVSEPSGVETRFDRSGDWVPLAANMAVSLDGLADGVHPLGVRATDPAGNQATREFAISVDGSSPALAWCADAYVRSGETLTLCWTVEDGASGVGNLTLLIDGVPHPLETGARSWSGQLPPGDHVILLSAVDRVGNLAEIRLALTDPAVELPTHATLLIAFATSVVLVAIAWLFLRSRGAGRA